MRAAAPLLAILVLLAGCASPAPPTTAPPASPGTSASATPSVCANCTRQPVAATLAIDWSGKLGEQAIACAPQPLGCHTFSQDAGSSHSDNLAAGNLTAVRLEMAWTATTPATRALTLGVMVMGCAGCPLPYHAEASGASPLVVDLKGLRVALNGTQALRLYVYNPAGNVEQDPGYAYATGDQAFTAAPSSASPTAPSSPTSRPTRGTPTSASSPARTWRTRTACWRAPARACATSRSPPPARCRRRSW